MLKMKLTSLILTFFIVNLSFAQTTVTPGDGTLALAIQEAQPNDVLQLIGGAVYTHSSSKSFALLDKPIVIQVEPASTEKAIIKLAEFVSAGSYYFFMLLNGSSLTLKGLDINGLVDEVPLAKSMIKFDGSPDPTAAKIGTIRFEDCVFHDFADNIIHGMTESTMKGMIQDSLFINNVIVYNAQAFLQYKHVSLRYLELKNTTIYKLSSMAIKIGKERYRGYTKISPTAFIDHCIFDDMGGEHGHIQVDNAYYPFTIINCIISNIQDPTQPGLFMNDPKIDTAAIVKNTCFWKSGSPPSKVEPLWPGYVFQDTVTMDPEYKDAANGDFTLPVGSTLLTFGTDSGPIGDPRWATNASTDVRQGQGKISADFYLSQNYPNPFNPTTTIDFSIMKKAHVQLHIYDISGSIVATLVSGELNSGIYSVKWDASKIWSGIYFYRLTTDGKSEMRKMTLLK